MPPPGLEFNRVLGVVKDGAGIHLLCDEPTTDDATTAPTQAVLSVWQRPWKSEDGAALFSALPNEYSTATRNDKHTKAVVHDVGTADLKVHHAVTVEDIARYTPGARVEVRETAAMYAKVTLPYVVETQRDRHGWIHNCLTHTQESETILYEDSNVMLLPDSKWDGADPAQVYVLALFKDLDLLSVRDFRGEHIGVLEHLRTAARAILQAKWGLPPSKFRAYFHYHPNYWLAHVHFVAHSSAALSHRVLLLDDVIDNLKVDGEFYRKAGLTVNLAEGGELHTRMVQFLGE